MHKLNRIQIVTLIVINNPKKNVLKFHFEYIGIIVSLKCIYYEKITIYNKHDKLR